MKIFIDDDAGYKAWTNAPSNAEGFVVNCHRTPVPSYLMLHKVNCPTINRLPANGSKWTEQFIKICSCDATELKQWASQQVGGQLRPCGTCKPSIVLPTTSKQPVQGSAPGNPSQQSKSISAQPINAFDLVCPNSGCRAQHTYNVDINSSHHNLICPACKTKFHTRIAKVRSGNSRFSRPFRYFSIRIKEFSGSEDLIEFSTFGNVAFEFKSSDVVGFTYIDQELRVIQNITINRCMYIDDKAAGCGKASVIVFIVMFILVKLFYASHILVAGHY